MRLIAALMALSCSSLAVCAQSDKRVYSLDRLAKATISLGKHRITVWIMDTPGKRTEGMMYLAAADVKPNQGMLFVFPEARPQSFWNRNVSFDLDIAFLDEKGKVVHATWMKANDPTSTPSNGPALYVLEMRRGAFQRLGIKKGAVLTLPHGLKGS